MYTAVTLMRAPEPDKVGAPWAAAGSEPCTGNPLAAHVSHSHTGATVSPAGINLYCTSIPPEQPPSPESRLDQCYDRL